MVSELTRSMANQGSPSPTSETSTATMSFAPKVFASSIADKLNEEDFLPWRHEALASIKGHKLQKHLERSKVPERYRTEEDRASEVETEEYVNWEQQDHHLVSWLLSSMDSSFKNRMVGCNFAHEIWSRIKKYFASQTRSKVKQLKTQLKSIKKQGMAASEYLLKIKKTTDALAAVGAPLSTAEHIEVILDGLNEDYGPFITTVMNRVEPYEIDELEAVLMAQEEMLERFKKDDTRLIQAHLAQTSIRDTRGFTNNRGGGR